MRFKRFKAIWALVAFSVYLLSFFLPARKVDEQGELAGYQCFLFALASPFLWPVWSANLFFLTGVERLVFGKPDTAEKFAIIASVLAFFAILYLPPVGDFTIGYYAWLGSMLLLVLGSTFHTEE